MEGILARKNDNGGWVKIYCRGVPKSFYVGKDHRKETTRFVTRAPIAENFEVVSPKLLIQW